MNFEVLWKGLSHTIFKDDSGLFFRTPEIWVIFLGCFVLLELIILLFKLPHYISDGDRQSVGISFISLNLINILLSLIFSMIGLRSIILGIVILIKIVIYKIYLWYVDVTDK